MVEIRQILILFTAFSFDGTDAGQFTVKTKNAASLIDGNEEVECHVTYNTSAGSDGSNVGNETGSAPSYHVYWNFTAIGSQNPVTVLKFFVQPNADVVVDWSASEKYKQGTETNLNIIGVTHIDGGTYTCYVEAGDQVVSSQAEVYIVETAACHDTKDYYVTGERTELKCIAGYYGSKAPNVYWIMSNRRINSTDLQIKTNIVEATLGLQTNVDMNGKIVKCFIEYGGIFTTSCQSSPLILNVTYPVQNVSIHIYPYTKDYKYERGLTVKMYCKARGNPDPQFYWTFSPADGRRSKDFAKTHHLLIHNIHPSDQGNYTCTAVNHIKTISYNKLKTIYIKVAETYAPYGGYQHIVSHNTDNKMTGEGDKKGQDNTGDINISPFAIGAIVSAVLAIVLIFVFIFLAIKFKARDRRMRQQFSRIHDETLDDQEVELLDENIQPTNTSDPPKLKQFWEIPRKDVRMTELISRGSYVEVWKGRMRKYPEKEEVIRIAIKKISDEATEKDRKFFLAEMEVLKMLKPHINIIQIIGCYTLNEPWLIMLEYAQDGTLFEYLQNGRPGDDQEVEITSNVRQSVKLKKKRLDSYRLLALAAQVANGLEHLNRFKLIYYRLRSLSVLMAKGGICKLSGFGFPQDIKERNIYEANSAPIRWMSPESIKDNIYNVKTDIWSYGITMWEVLHFGTTPYPEMGPQEAEESIMTGYIMPQPAHCSDKIYNIMASCWDPKPENRPGYNTILQWLTSLASEHSSHVNLDKLTCLADSSFSSSFSTSPEDTSATSTEKDSR